jgi:hypothetical protein
MRRLASQNTNRLENQGSSNSRRGARLGSHKIPQLHSLGSSNDVWRSPTHQFRSSQGHAPSARRSPPGPTRRAWRWGSWFSWTTSSPLETIPQRSSSSAGSKGLRRVPRNSWKVLGVTLPWLNTSNVRCKTPVLVEQRLCGELGY